MNTFDPNKEAQANVLLTPCKAACKNDNGICSGCLRTMDEIIGWQSFSMDQRASVIAAISGTKSTHICPNCQANAQCDIKEGKETCWCFGLEKRDVQQLPLEAQQADRCVCRHCLQQLPLL